MKKIRLGFAPTRRSIFSAPDAIKYANLTRKKLDEMGVDYVDITDINEEGLLYDDNDRIKIAQKFKEEKVDGLFLPHTNFGTEYECARLAKELNVPVLLWDRGTRGRMKRAYVSATASADYLLQEKSSEDSRCPLLI